MTRLDGITGPNGHEFEETQGEVEDRKPGMLQFMGCKEERDGLANEQ